MTTTPAPQALGYVPGLYTYGYTGGSVEDLLGYVRGGAVILDIRFSPNSRAPQWRKEHLEAALSDEYRWVPALGNRNYRNGGPIQIADLNAGLDIISDLFLDDTSIVLLCACPLWYECHRGTVAYEASQLLPAMPVRHLVPGVRLDHPFNCPACSDTGILTDAHGRYAYCRECLVQPARMLPR